jgi:heme/copper-type cytochrome/quinol oxidase subunit 2
MDRPGYKYLYWATMVCLLVSCFGLAVVIATDHLFVTVVWAVAVVVTIIGLSVFTVIRYRHDRQLRESQQVDHAI